MYLVLVALNKHLPADRPIRTWQESVCLVTKVDAMTFLSSPQLCRSVGHNIGIDHIHEIASASAANDAEAAPSLKLLTLDQTQ